MFLQLLENQNRRTFDFNNNQSFQLDTIYKDEYGDGHETFRAIRHSIIGISLDYALVFDERVESWADFFNGRFKQILIPHFLKISALANEGDYFAIIVEDKRFLKNLEDQSASRLIEAASAIFDAREGAKGIQLMKKILRNHPNCTFTTAFSMQCSAFNISLLQSMISYSYMEWVCGQKTTRFSLENMHECEKLFYNEFPNFTDCLGKMLSENSGDLKLTA